MTSTPMSHRFLAALGVCAAVIAIVSLAPVPAAGQAGSGDGAQAAADTGMMPRTPWGDPDLQGIWDYRTITPLERPEELAGKAVLTDEEAAKFQAQTNASRHKDRRVADGLTPERDVSNAYNHFWWDYGDTLTEDKRTSLIVDPLDGRIPAYTPEGQRRADLRSERRGRPAHGPEDRNVWERCIVGTSATPMNPGAYNNNTQLFQIPGYVVILNETIHDVRIIPLDGRPHLPEQIRQWKGDSRGRWEDDTLVVDTVNFSGKAAARGSGKGLHLVERFTRASADQLVYEYTIDDAQTFTKPWSVMVPMKKTEAPLFEYACHEGNYGMVNLLAGARAQDVAAAAEATRQPH